MATKNIVPRANGEGGIGTSAKKWLTGYINTLYGNLTGNVNGNVSGSSGSCTGNAATATALATGRNIQTNLASTSAASFNGSANITPGVTGILGKGNGGLGNTTGDAATLGGQTATQLIAAAQAGVAAGNTVAVLTGTTAPTGEGNVTYTMPLPSGFTEAQCKFFGVITVYATSIGAATTRPTLFVVSRTTTVNAGYTLYYIVIGVK